jgi:hypothetical protein
VSYRPPDLSEAAEARLTELRAALVGARLTGVRYALVSSGVWPGAETADARAHEVDMGVALDFGSRELNLTWAMSGADQGLSVMAGPVPPDHFGIGSSMLDAGGVEPWPVLLGRQVTAVAWAVHRPTDDGTERVWAVRIDLDGASVVIALGELDNGLPRYQPDALLVLFDADLAQFYAIPAADGTAWGGER